jgi:hypothetical protein
MKIGIFTAIDKGNLVEQCVQSCKELGVDYEIVDIVSADWIKNVQISDCDGFFCASTCSSQERKTILDERYYFVSQIMKRPIYPDFLAIFIHENKRNMVAWLEINNFPHVKTKVFTDRKEAKEYLKLTSYPIVIKANVGAGASKVRIVKSKFRAKRFLQVFPRIKDYFNIGKFYSLKIHKIFPFMDLHNPQKDYLLVQEYKNIIHEWRIIKIGNSYFGHQKLLNGKFASGSGKVGWVAPPQYLLLMVKKLCEKGEFLCMDVDIFETKSGEYFINELQSSFGSYLDYQMCIDGVPGRYKYINGKFVFEEGKFNVYGSNKLKIEHFIEVLSNK